MHAFLTLSLTDTNTHIQPPTLTVDWYVGGLSLCLHMRGQALQSLFGLPLIHTKRVVSPPYWRTSCAQTANKWNMSEVIFLDSQEKDTEQHHLSPVPPVTTHNTAGTGTRNKPPSPPSLHSNVLHPFSGLEV